MGGVECDALIGIGRRVAEKVGRRVEKEMRIMQLKIDLYGF